MKWTQVSKLLEQNIYIWSLLKSFLTNKTHRVIISKHRPFARHPDIWYHASYCVGICKSTQKKAPDVKATCYSTGAKYNDAMQKGPFSRLCPVRPMCKRKYLKRGPSCKDFIFTDAVNN